MMSAYQQRPLAGLHQSAVALPQDYRPRRPAHFGVDRIYLAKGSLSSPERRRFLDGICALYPDAGVIECPDVPHNRIDLGVADPLQRHRVGKRTLVLCEHRSAVRFAAEEGNTCPNYWHFSVYGYCPYDCAYCYLAGTPGVWFSPTVKIFVNLAEILRGIDAVAGRADKETAFYLGKLQDGLALDPLTAYSTVLVPFFARHRWARQIILTKSAQVDRLLGLEHGGHTVLSWSVNPGEVARTFEGNAPPVDDRISAMRRCAESGYPVRAVLMPVIPVEGWRERYRDFVRRLLSEVPLQRLTVGGICSYKNARALMERELGASNCISGRMERVGKSQDGRLRYPAALRVDIYDCILDVVKEVRPDLELALCLEEPPVWNAVAERHPIGRCNCIL